MCEAWVRREGSRIINYIYTALCNALLNIEWHGIYSHWHWSCFSIFHSSISRHLSLIRWDKTIRYKIIAWCHSIDRSEVSHYFQAPRRIPPPTQQSNNPYRGQSEQSKTPRSVVKPPVKGQTPRRVIKGKGRPDTDFDVCDSGYVCARTDFNVYDGGDVSKKWLRCLWESRWL